MLVGLSPRLRAVRSCVPLFLIAFLFLTAAYGQETTAGFQGTVKDATGGGIPNATLELQGSALIGTRKVQSDNEGNYRFAALPPGTGYVVTVTAKGFRTVKQGGIDLSVGRLPNVDIKLEIGTVTETVEVSSLAAVVDTTQSKVAATVEKSILDNIPKGRSFDSLIPFAPGSRMEPLQGTSGGGYQIDGASDGENVYLVDGINTTQIQSGGVGKSYQM